MMRVLGAPFAVAAQGRLFGRVRIQIDSTNVSIPANLPGG